ncbi:MULTISPECIES: dethiobiotin synthase [unclassified Neisseria]|uniref:dethiobiotin synthase n=1 Tax=unclassified Neisseria TaxID=2623750 RepID=UPI001D16E4C9|nr:MULTISPECIES: dethiobiotin synthase [unclassified Neisseria]
MTAIRQRPSETMQQQVYFVTGTDTGAGKTFCTAAMLQAAAQAGRRSIGFKPVASGADGSGTNTDVAVLQAASTVRLPYALHNIYTFAEATAPHLAAADAGVSIEAAALSRGLAAIKQHGDFVLVEGAGGWLTPLCTQTDFAGWVAAERLAVILVVGLKLGCINHALLTAQAVRHTGLPLAGWVANCLSAQPHRFADYLAALRARISAPLLGVMPFLPQAGAKDAAAYVDISALLPASDAVGR